MLKARDISTFKVIGCIMFQAKQGCYWGNEGCTDHSSLEWGLSEPNEPTPWLRS